jgi:hypothetical protein
MAFEEGNQYWKLRSKHGRDKIIESPEVFANASDEYFQWCVDNPIIEIDYRGKDLKKVELPHPRVFKKEELARFCGVAKWETVNNLKKVSDDFMEVVTRVEGIIADQKYTYAVVGMFNSNIVARDLGLADKSDHKHSGEVKTGYSEADEIRRQELIKLLKEGDKEG